MLQSQSLKNLGSIGSFKKCAKCTLLVWPICQECILKMLIIVTKMNVIIK